MKRICAIAKMQLLLLFALCIALPSQAEPQIDNAPISDTTGDSKDAYKVVDAISVQKGLRHRPFDRAFETKSVRNGYGNASANAPDGEMEFKAVLFDDEYPMVNVGGHILAIGDQHNGYTLKEVSRETAVFYKQGRATLLQLEPADGDELQLIAGDDGY